MTQTRNRISLAGRYFAALSMLPYILLAVAGFFLLAFILVALIIQDPEKSFFVVFTPFVLGCILMAPMFLFFLFLMKWHGRRTMDVLPEGILVVNPRGSTLFLRWDHLVAVELRFAMPRIVSCSLLTPSIRFSFTNLEINLTRRGHLRYVFEEGFRLDRMRQLLQFFHLGAPHMEWRVSQGFQDRFRVFYPPYDLENMK